MSVWLESPTEMEPFACTDDFVGDEVCDLGVAGPARLR